MFLWYVEFEYKPLFKSLTFLNTMHRSSSHNKSYVFWMLNRSETLSRDLNDRSQRLEQVEPLRQIIWVHFVMKSNVVWWQGRWWQSTTSGTRERAEARVRDRLKIWSRVSWEARILRRNPGQQRKWEVSIFWNSCWSKVKHSWSHKQVLEMAEKERSRLESEKVWRNWRHVSRKHKTIWVANQRHDGSRSSQTSSLLRYIWMSKSTERRIVEAERTGKRASACWESKSGGTQICFETELRLEYNERKRWNASPHCREWRRVRDIFERVVRIFRFSTRSRIAFGAIRRSRREDRLEQLVELEVSRWREVESKTWRETINVVWSQIYVTSCSFEDRCSR